MSDACNRTFPEEYLSGYLDGALTQGEAQQVRVHLEDCETCRSAVEQMRRLREVTMNSQFEVPPDDQWDERPRGPLSRFSLGLGWLLLVIWFVALIGYALWEVATSGEDLVSKLLVFGGLSGFVLLLLSVLLDRIRTYRSDRYRRVQK